MSPSTHPAGQHVGHFEVGQGAELAVVAHPPRHQEAAALVPQLGKLRAWAHRFSRMAVSRRLGRLAWPRRRAAQRGGARQRRAAVQRPHRVAPRLATLLTGVLAGERLALAPSPAKPSMPAISPVRPAHL